MGFSSICLFPTYWLYPRWGCAFSNVLYWTVLKLDTEVPWNNYIRDALSMITINLKSDYITSLLFWTKTCVISRIWLILGSGIISSSQWLFLVMRLHFGQIKCKRPSQMCLQTPAHPAPCTEYQYMCCVDYFYNYVSVPTGSSVIIYMKV